MKGFEMKKFAETEQWVKPTESPTKVPTERALRCSRGSLLEPTSPAACQWALWLFLWQPHSRDTAPAAGETPDASLLFAASRSPPLVNS